MRLKEPRFFKGARGETAAIVGAALKGCWCVEIKLSEETRRKLKENFRACLCRNCLENFVSAEVEK